MTTLPTYPAVLRATPEGQTLDQWTKFEFAPSMGAWRWESAHLDREWTGVEAATQAGLFGPCSSVDTTARTIAVWCEPWKAGETLRLLRSAGIGSAMSYVVVVERGRPCNETRMSAVAGASEPETMGELPAPKAEPTGRQRQAIAHAREERREGLEPLRLEVSRAISAAGWRRSRPVVERVLGHPVNGPRGAWWSQIGKRAGAKILEGLSAEPPALMLDFGQMEDAASADIPEPSGVPAVETASIGIQERTAH